MLNFFLLEDEPDLAHWQSGLERVDGSHRPSYDSVKQTIAQTGGNCLGKSVVWRHATGVILPTTAWGSLARQPSTRKSWRFTVSAGEEAAYVAGLFKAGPSKTAIAKRLAGGRPKPLLSSKGTIEATKKLVGFGVHKLKPGKYVYGVRMSATMNSKRVSVFVSRPFQVGARK
jgi:hypothetical protein